MQKYVGIKNKIGKCFSIVSYVTYDHEELVRTSSSSLCIGRATIY